jgi:hypothetical protein
MSSIRRLLSGISSAASWATRYEISAPIRQQPTAPVEPVRRGFSDHSDFQSAAEAESSLLDAHAPNLIGRSRKTPEALRVYSGLSDFQAFRPRYQHLLGTNVPPPPARYWEAGRARSPAPAAPQAEPPRESSRRPGLTATADLEKAFERMGEEDQALLYKAESAESGRSVLQHLDGSVTDPKSPESRFADVEAWERANPGLTRAVSLSRNDLELVLAMPEGPARDEVLSELASADSFTASAVSAAEGDAFLPSLEDLPVNSEPETELAGSDAFMPSLEDLPGSDAPVEPLLEAAAEDLPLTHEEFQGLFSPTGGLAEGRLPLDVAGLVARRGTPEMQARVASALYERGQSPDTGAAAPSWLGGAALAASASPQATQALLHHIGETRLADFVRSVMQA